MWNFFRRKPQWPSRKARLWSNEQLRLFAPLFKGNIINVSAWKDEDKEGNHYQDYFTSASCYTTSNHKGWRGEEVVSDYWIDLEEPLPNDLPKSFDIVFNHTTLEHIYKVNQAFENLCTLSRDIVILVVPFHQRLHGPENGDFWRLSPYTVRRLFQENGFEVLYESASLKCDVIYLFSIASCMPQNWHHLIPVHALSVDHIGLSEREYKG